MPFDPSTAKPLPGGFDPGTAKPETQDQVEDKAVFGVYPKQRAVPSTPETRAALPQRLTELGLLPPEEEKGMDLSKVPSAGGLGAALGVAGPKALQYGGRFVSAVGGPAGKVAGAGMQALGTSLSKIPTAQRVITSGAGFAGAEVGGQAAEAAGAPAILGQIPGVAAAQKGVSAAEKALIGTTQPATAKLAKREEQKGYVFEPGQLRKDRPLGSPGFGEASKAINEQLATREATKETGKVTDNITPQFLKSRVDDLGKEYKDIFGRNLTIDTELVNTLKQMKNFEASVDPAGVGPVRTTANNIISRWNEEFVKAQQKNIENRIKNIMRQQQRGGVDPIVRLRKDWPTIRNASSGQVPEWFANIETTVNQLSDELGLVVTPKVWVSSPRREGLYGMATGDGHIIINDKLDVNGALATALHEFGHQAEFQLFAHAPYETRNAIVKAYQEQMASTPMGKTIGQHRPLTSEKYGAQAQASVPEEGFERGYLRNFNEWFAEQTSRWITQTKEPTNKVEKFFAKVADTWKAIYQKIVGYIPLTSEVDKFFRSQWKGGIMSEAIPQIETKALSAAEPAVLGGDDVTAKISGEELQRLRSNLTRIARTARDGSDRRAAGDFVNAIDEAIGRHDPALLERLRKTNREYAATSILGEGIEKGWVSQGKISPQGLGEHLANNTYGFGIGTSQHPLYDLGYAGRELRLRSRVEGEEFPKYDLVAALLGRGRQALAGVLGGRTQTARDIQRYLTEVERKKALEEAKQARSKGP